MKKTIFALSGLLLLTVASCQKEEIEPNQQDDFERNIITDDSGDEKSNNFRGFFIGDKVSDSTYTITDPNRDEDEERKIKRK